MATRNVTVALDEATARWARVEAARCDTSVSKLVAGMLRDRMARERSYEDAMSSYLSGAPRPLKSGGFYPERDSLHERADLRR